MAQQNRRKSRKGGSTTRKPQRLPDETEETTPGTYESGEEQLTEAQMAVGRPAINERPSEQELTDFEEADAGRHGGGGSGNGNGSGDLVRPGGGDGDGQRRSGAVAERRPNLLLRTIGFVKGSWRELKRVQWPDRRQVFQATGVVLGFVIVAGAFLGLASFAAQKIVNLILYGHG